MTSLGKASRVAVALLLAGGALAGCAPEPADPTPSTTPSSRPSSTPAASPSPTPERTSPAPTPSSAPAETPAPEPPVEFTPAELVQVCIDATASGYGGEVGFDTANARIEERTVTPEWLVLVPADGGGYIGQSVCTIGGSPTDPVIGLSSASIEPLPEEQIQRLIRGENEGGTD